MEIPHYPFETIDWINIPKEIHAGNSGMAYWQIMHVGNIRVRMVEYSANYEADHWCSKGHIIYCIAGEMVTALQDGRNILLKKGMTYHVGDNSEAHRSVSKNGCKLFIVD